MTYLKDVQFFWSFFYPSTYHVQQILPSNVLNRKPCTCDGCELDNAPSISAKNNCWFKIQQKVPIDLISHTLSIVLLIKNVVTDAKVGFDYFNEGHTFWAIAIWILMFLPALMCFAMELIVKKCLKSLSKILGLLPVGQVWYHFKVILSLTQLRQEMMEQIDFYSKLDYDNLPSDIKDQLEPRSKKYHDAKDRYNLIMSDLKTMKARPCSFILFICTSIPKAES